MLHVPLHAWAKDGSRFWTFNPDSRQWFEIRLIFPHFIVRHGTSRARAADVLDKLTAPVAMWWPCPCGYSIPPGIEECVKCGRRREGGR